MIFNIYNNTYSNIKLYSVYLLYFIYRPNNDGIIQTIKDKYNV